MAPTQDNLLEIYQLNHLNGIMDGSVKKIAILQNVSAFYQTKSGIALVALNSTLRVIFWKDIEALTSENLNVDANKLKGLTDVSGDFNVTACHTTDRIIVGKPGQGEEGCS